MRGIYRRIAAFSDGLQRHEALRTYLTASGLYGKIMNTYQLYSTEPVEHLFPNARRASPFSESEGRQLGKWLEAEKEGKFYIIYDLRGVAINVTGLASLNGTKGGRTFPLLVQEFESEEERSQERENFIARCSQRKKRVVCGDASSDHPRLNKRRRTWRT